MAGDQTPVKRSCRKLIAIRAAFVYPIRLGKLNDFSSDGDYASRMDSSA
jgi:hypothetical protein